MRNTITLASALVLASASAQLSNGGFETVLVAKDPAMSRPYNWTFGQAFGAGLVGDAHGGDYALSVWNWYWYAEGYTTNGPLGFPGPYGMPVTGHPTQLTGWFKRMEGDLEEGEGNQAQVFVLLTRWNSTTQQRDTVGSGEQLFGEQATWAPFTLDIGYTSAVAADTVVVKISSCVDCICTGESTGECAYFYVDDLALVSTTGISDAVMEISNVRLLPQGDGSAVVRVAAQTSLPLRLQLWDALGRRVGDVRVSSDGQRIALPAVPGVVLFDASTGQRSIGRGRILVD